MSSSSVGMMSGTLGPQHLRYVGRAGGAAGSLALHGGSADLAGLDAGPGVLGPDGPDQPVARLDHLTRAIWCLDRPVRPAVDVGLDDLAGAFGAVLVEQSDLR